MPEMGPWGTLTFTGKVMKQESMRGARRSSQRDFREKKEG